MGADRSAERRGACATSRGSRGTDARDATGCHSERSEESQSSRWTVVIPAGVRNRCRPGRGGPLSRRARLLICPLRGHPRLGMTTWWRPARPFPQSPSVPTRCARIVLAGPDRISSARSARSAYPGVDTDTMAGLATPITIRSAADPQRKLDRSFRGRIRCPLAKPLPDRTMAAIRFRCAPRASVVRLERPWRGEARHDPGDDGRHQAAPSERTEPAGRIEWQSRSS